MLMTFYDEYLVYVNFQMWPVNKEDNGDKPDTSYSKGWPTDNLPTGFPVYPGGQPEYNIVGVYISIVITSTDKNTFEGYMDDLKAWGFEISEPDSEGFYTGLTQNWKLGIVFAEGINATILAVEPSD